MLLQTPLLPPQFLLPAWSSRQLARVARQAQLSTQSNLRSSPPRERSSWQRRGAESVRNTGEPEHLKALKDKLKDTLWENLPKSSTSKPHPPKTKPEGHTPSDRVPGFLSGWHSWEQNWEHPTEAEESSTKREQPVRFGGEKDRLDVKEEPQSQVSLFGELFPEEKLKQPNRSIEKKSFKLPAFPWSPIYPSSHAEAKDSAAESHDIPQRTVSREDSVETTSRYAALTENEPSVLTLSACSQTLEETDFFRLGVKGSHIEGWTTGILKVIPARDEQTLRMKDHYYILFSSDAAARAYLDQTIRLHTLSKMRGIDKENIIPPPPGYLRPGENLKTVLRGYSMVPGHTKLSLRMIQRPYQPALQRVLKHGGPVASASAYTKSDHMVLFYLSGANVTHYYLVNFLYQDGIRRNLEWKLAGGRNNVYKIKGSESEKRRTPERYVIPFKDQQEARRFVREWHRREFPMAKKKDDRGELPPIVNAEIIW